LNNIQLNIVANAQFQQVYAEVAKLKAAMNSLQRTSVGGPFTPAVVADIRAAQTQFDSAIASTRAFNIQQVAMTDSVAKFGSQLSKGQLSLSNYYKIWRDSAKGASAEIDALAASQARLNRSVAIANPLKPGYAKLITDINGVVTAEEKLIFQQQALNTALQQGAMKLVNFGKNTQWMGRQLTVGLTMPLVMFGAATSSAYLKFDQQMTSMLKVYGSHAEVQSQKTLDVIRKQVTDLADKLARTLGVAMADTVEVAKTFSSIGLEGQNLIAATEATVKLQKLGDLTAQQASTSMVALQNVFKLQANQIADAVNFLNAAKHSTSTTMQDIVDALPRVGPIIQQMGGSYKDFATLLVSLKESGIPAAQGANAIKSMLASMINPTKAATVALSNLHINLKQIVASNQGNLMGMVQGLQHALDALPQSQRLQAIEQVFGKFQFARVTALLNNLGTAGSQSAKVLELYNKSNTQLAAVAQQELDVASVGTPAARFQKMKATLQADLIPLGRSFLESFTKIGNAVGHIIEAFKKLANLLGPAASLMGKIFGGGLAGLIVVGPVIMLAGLFANLVGNILRGANAIRMFKQGMASASQGENVFSAGLRGMRNFYQELDLSIIAARNQMDLMPEAITSNAKAFEILKAEIVSLTNQFKLLAVAQSSAMGVGLSGIGTTLPPAGAKFLPIVPRNRGGSIPGFEDGGQLYDPSQHGSVVPGPASVNYDSVLATVPVGGFVLNKQASKNNPGLASLPRFGGGGKMLAMLTPGEIVFDAATTAANYSLLNAANNGEIVGGTVTPNKPNYGLLESEMAAAVLAELRAGRSLPKSLIAEPMLQAGRTEAEIQTVVRKMNVAKTEADVLKQVMSHPELKHLISYKSDSAYAMDAAFNQETKGNAKALGQKYVNQFNPAGGNNPYALVNAIVPGGVTDIQARNIYKSLANDTRLLTGMHTEEEFGTYLQKAMLDAGVREDTISRLNEGSSFRVYYPKVDSAGNPIKGNGEARANAMIDLLKGAYPEGIFAKEYAPSRSGLGGKYKIRGTVNGRSFSITPAGTYNPSGTISYESLRKSMPAGTGKQWSHIPLTGTGSSVPGYSTGGNLGNSPRRNIPGYITGGQTLQSGMRSAGNFWRAGNTAGVMSEEAKMSSMGRMGTGMALTMAVPLAMNAIPSKIGGTDISAAKDTVSSASSMAGMAMMMGASGPAAAAIAGTIVAIKAASWAVGVLKKQHEEHLLVVKQTYTASTTAINMFNNALSQSPKQLAMKISALKKSDPLKNVSDLIKSQNGQEAINTLNAFTSSQVLSGMDPANVEKMVRSILEYTGQTNLLDGALKQIKKDNENLTVSTKTYLNKLNDASSANDKFARTYKELSSGGQNYATGLYNIVKGLQSGTLAGEKLTSVINGLSQNTNNAAEQMNLLRIAAQNAGDTTMTTLIDQIQKVITDAGQAKIALGELSGIQSLGVDITAILADNQNNSDLQNILSGKKNKSGKTLEDYVKAQRQAALDKIAADNKVLSAADNATSSMNKELKTLKEQKKVIDDQVKALETKTNQIKLQNDYLNKQTDLTNQIKEAEISGNYILAASLTQQQQQSTAQYKNDVKINDLKSKSEAKQTLIDDLTTKINDIGTAATKSAQAAQNLASYGKIVSEDWVTLLKEVKSIILTYLGKSPSDYKTVDPKKTPTLRGGGMQTVQNPEGAITVQGPTVNPTTGAPITTPSTFYLMKYGDKYYGVNTVSSDDIREASLVNGKWVIGKKVQGIQSQTLAPVKKANGGHINRFDTGGGVSGPGTGTSDSIPAYLSNGEYVIKAAAVKQYGTGLFDSLNAQRFGSGSKGGVKPSDYVYSTSFANSITNGSWITKQQSDFENKQGNDFVKNTLFEMSGIPAASRLLHGNSRRIGNSFLPGWAAKTAGVGLDVLMAIPFLKGMKAISTMEGLSKMSKAIEDYKLLQGATHASYDPGLSGKTLDPLIHSSNKADTLGRGNYLTTGDPLTDFAPNIYKLSFSSLLKGVRGKGLLTETQWKDMFGGGKYPGSFLQDSPEFQAYLRSKYTGIVKPTTNEVSLKYPTKYMSANPKDFIKPKIEIDTPLDMSKYIDAAGKAKGLATGGFVLPSYRVGTPYVPNDMIAQIHKGERIVPADQNNGAFGGTVNVYVNATGVTDPNQITKMAEEGVIKALKIKDAKINKTNMAVKI
jgi:TP901 family phage tail tape measure protein